MVRGLAADLNTAQADDDNPDCLSKVGALVGFINRLNYLNKIESDLFEQNVFTIQCF